MSSFDRCVILVADDEPGILQLVTFALKRHGYAVIPSSDGPSALRACEGHPGPIHLAVLDIMMPGMTGPTLFTCLQQLHPEIKALFMSGYAAQSFPGIAKGEDGMHFIPKPFVPRSLVERVNEILGNEDVCTLLDDEELTMV